MPVVPVFAQRGSSARALLAEVMYATYLQRRRGSCFLLGYIFPPLAESLVGVEHAYGIQGSDLMRRNTYFRFILRNGFVDRMYLWLG